MKPLALYMHIPFCQSKCIYCDFASYPGKQDLWDTYVNALLDELRGWREALKNYEVRTVFIGGGTPSLLPAEAIARILDEVRAQTRLLPDAEITMEANPGAFSLEKMKICRSAGVNRLSFGAQAMDDRLLRRLGRIHTAREVAEAVEFARRAGFDNLSLDLMYALPDQSMADWMDTLQKAAALEPEHLSAYSLIVEEGTPMARGVHSGKICVPDDDAAVDMQRAALDFLKGKGYHRYEISNFCREGHECRHNIVYWERGEYLGLGCAAHSLMNGVRLENPRGLKEYLDGERDDIEARLTREDEMEETLMLSTRMVRGMNLADYRARFGVDFEKAHAAALTKLKNLGLLEIEGGFLRLTVKGMELQNAVVVELLDA